MTGVRPYTDADLPSLQALVATGAQLYGSRGYLHPGDVPHHIYNALKLHNPSDVVLVWDGVRGIEAFGIVYPGAEPAFAFQADRRFVDWTALDDIASRFDVLAGAAVRLSLAAGKEPTAVGADLSEGDTETIAAYEYAGFTSCGALYAVTRCPLDDIPAIAPADGFVIRTPSGVDEADLVGQVHAESFGSTWEPGMYAKVMTSPGYDPAWELVMEVPDGRLAGFTVMWLDEVNRVGLFEPVGTSEHFRRHGVASALMTAGMARMADAGMTHAQVLHEVTNTASTRLYASLGFTRVGTIVDYQRPLQATT